MEVGLLEGAEGFWFVDAVTEAIVEDESRGNTLVLQAAIEFETVRNRNALIVASLLNEGWRFCFFDGGDRRSLCVNLRVVPRGGVEILASEWSDVGVHVVGHPVADACADGDG